MAGGRPTNEPAGYFAIGRQTAKDTEATTFYFFKHLDGTGLELENTVQREREGGDGQEVGLSYKSFIKADGQVVSNARAINAGRQLAYVLGADDASQVASGVFGNHYLIPTAVIPYLTVEQRYVDEIERVINANFTGLQIEGEAGRPVKMTANFVGGGSQYRRAIASALTPTRETGRPFFFPNASVVIDGAANSKITKYSLNIRRGVDEGIQTTGLTREDVVPLNFDVDLDFTLKYEDPDLYNKIQYGGAAATVVPIPLSTGSFDFISKEGASNMLRVCMPVFEYADAKVNKLDPDGKTVYVDVTAMNIKGGTHSVFGQVLNSDPTSYLLP